MLEHTMIKVVGGLDNLRRAPGSQGCLKRHAGLAISKYMTANQSSQFTFPTIIIKVQWNGICQIRNEPCKLGT